MHLGQGYFHYATAEEISASIDCGSGDITVQRLSGNGILSIDEGCHARVGSHEPLVNLESSKKNSSLIIIPEYRPIPFEDIRDEKLKYIKEETGNNVIEEVNNEEILDDEADKKFVERRLQVLREVIEQQAQTTSNKTRNVSQETRRKFSEVTDKLKTEDTIIKVLTAVLSFFCVCTVALAYAVYYMWKKFKGKTNRIDRV